MQEEYLDPDYLPEILPHREAEIAAVFSLLKPVAEGKKPINVFIHGPAGIGKTAVARLILKKFGEQGVRPVYVNCWYFRTEGAVLAEILRQMGIPVPRKGRSIDELVQTFVEAVQKERMVVVLDEVDVIENDRVLYELSRASQKMGIVLISNDRYAFRKFDQRIRSSLAPETIEFRRYSVEEILDILKERVKLARIQISPDALRVAARFTFKHSSDIRYGLTLLLRAARNAPDTVEIEHIKAIEVESDPKMEKRERDLKEEHRKIIDALRNLGGEAESRAVMNEYRRIGGAGAERTFRKYVSELIQAGFIEPEIEKGRGRKRTLKLRSSP